MEWQFDNSIAKIFASHARQHIPNYDDVIDLSVDLCNQYYEKNDAILEVGCAIGETISRLHQTGFTNIHGVEASESMLAACPKHIATYYLSKSFPESSTPYKVVLCNWTLHFIDDKRSYLSAIARNLTKDGMLVLTEKTANEGIPLEQYHKFKLSSGVSHTEIKQKAESLKNVMHIDSVEWYFNTLRESGFSKIYIASANWCFTTFVATI
jgi:ubiquinone/menaquinone biosynthesis C-methylase UbiE